MLPFRAKNPPDHFPFVTILLIVANTAIFALTSKQFLVIRTDVVQDYAVSHDTLSLWRLMTAMFLHNDPLHLAGNMLFLWIFGGPVEGRLRPWIFLPAYLLAGLAGGMLHEVFLGASHPNQFSLGASGAIMGVAGMYLYMFPYSLICAVHRQYWLAGWFSVSDIQARWVILYYIGFDLLYQLLFRGADGVGHLAHLGGFACGFLVTLLLRVRRDDLEVSTVQATRAEMKDYSLLSFNDLATLMRSQIQDTHLVMAYCEKALTSGGGAHHQECVEALNHNMPKLIEQIDAERLAWLLLSIPASYGGVHPLYYMRLASQLQSRYSNDYAARLYRRVYDINPAGPDSEAALFRLGRLTEQAFGNRQEAAAIYAELVRLFPNGEMALEVRRSRAG